MKRRDWIPGADEAFNDWAVNFMGILDAKKTAWGLPTAAHKVLKDLFAAWCSAWKTYLAPNHGTADTLAKNKALAAFKKGLRDFVNEYIRYNHLITDVDKRNLRIPVPREKRKNGEDPTTRPEADIIYGLRQLTIRFRDEGSKRWAKPAGIHSVEICWAILDHLPVDIEELIHSVSDTKSPYTFSFAEHDRGKICYLALRWINGTNGRGAWSQIYNAIIP